MVYVAKDFVGYMTTPLNKFYTNMSRYDFILLYGHKIGRNT